MKSYDYRRGLAWIMGAVVAKKLWLQNPSFIGNGKDVFLALMGINDTILNGNLRLIEYHIPFVFVSEVVLKKTKWQE